VAGGPTPDFTPIADSNRLSPLVSEVPKPEMAEADYTECSPTIDGAPSAAQRYRAATSAGDPRAALHPALQPSPGDCRVAKTGYSAFWPGACDLRERLVARGIDTVLIAGAIRMSAARPWSATPIPAASAWSCWPTP
jgi:nicotinamidase-related amidase